VASGDASRASSGGATVSGQFSINHLAALTVVALLDHRQILQVALDALGEVVVLLALDYPQTLPAPAPPAGGQRLAAEAWGQP
jgi:hypothetical protein